MQTNPIYVVQTGGGPSGSYDNIEKNIATERSDGTTDESNAKAPAQESGSDTDDMRDKVEEEQ